jgi:hypothetical protein
MKPLKPVNRKRPQGKPALRPTFTRAQIAAMSASNKRAFARLAEQANR